MYRSQLSQEAELIAQGQQRFVRDLSQRAPVASGRRPDEVKLAGPSLVQQEPDLANETGLTARELSGWAMAGSGAFE